jgi:hypothetical protein
MCIDFLFANTIAISYSVFVDTIAKELTMNKLILITFLLFIAACSIALGDERQDYGDELNAAQERAQAELDSARADLHEARTALLEYEEELDAAQDNLDALTTLTGGYEITIEELEEIGGAQ